MRVLFLLVAFTLVCLIFANQIFIKPEQAPLKKVAYVGAGFFALLFLIVLGMGLLNSSWDF